MLRNHQWLQKQLDFLLTKYFADLTITTPIEIKFGREAKYRFGSIRLYKPRSHLRGVKLFSPRRWKSSQPQKSVITITSLFAKQDVLAKVVQYTIAHEICHYHHGFSSANRRLFKYPHHGGVVNNELTRRGADDLISAYKKWLKIYRKKILKGKISV